jgi:hypothetical protein
LVVWPDKREVNPWPGVLHKRIESEGTIGIEIGSSARTNYDEPGSNQKLRGIHEAINYLRSGELVFPSWGRDEPGRLLKASSVESHSFC